MKELSILVLSCDKYKACWQHFFTLLDKHYANHNKTYLATETLNCEYADETININSNIWSERFRQALEHIDTEYVLILLDDFFIRNTVDDKRIEYCLSQMNDDIAVFNFEKKYRQCDESNLKGFNRQFNNQVYLNSCQPSLWSRKALIDRLQANQNAWEWELTTVSDKRLCYINTEDFIIDVGYNNTLNWGISRGTLTDECKDFLESEGLDIQW